jgi:hypothetical protein
VLEAIIIDPFALIDEHTMHQCDLPSRTTEAEAADFE